MKKLVTLLAVVVLTANMFSQNYLISFAGSGDTTSVNSVLIENLTQDTRRTIEGSDQLRLLESASGLNPDIENKQNTIKIYPNPAISYCKVEFEAPQAGNTFISVYDISGKKVLHQRRQLAEGIHAFHIAGLNSGFYSIQVRSKHFNYTGKLIIQAKTGTKAQINYTGQTSKTIKSGILKGTTVEVEMQYNDGDRLKFTGSCGKYSTVVIDIPAESKTITFGFTSCTDGDGNNYPVVKIGSKVWMAENLATTKYKYGTDIPLVTDNTEWTNLLTPGYCWYDNDEAKYKDTYGALYNWYVVQTKNICPVGWHVPTDNEWIALADYFGGGSVAGGKLKETGTAHWRSPNTGATNESGFTALPGGHRYDYSGTFHYIKNYTTFWTSIEENDTKAWYRQMIYSAAGIARTTHPKKYGCSVRCVK